MSELVTVEVSRVHPNPWRDGTGNATWESVRETYGYNQKKLEDLAASISKNGMWEGIIARQSGPSGEVRRKPGGVELAFGHHRIEAARLAGLKSIRLIVRDLTDDQMLTFLAHENNEDFGNDFYLSVMCPIAAVVRAYAEGAVELGIQPRESGAAFKTRYAPSFSHLSGPAGEKPYNAGSLGRYLGWQKKDGKGGMEADGRIQTALSALELIELGALKPGQLKGQTKAAIELVVEQARKTLVAAKQNFEGAVKVHEEAAKRAEKSGDTKRAEQELRIAKQVEEKAKEGAIKVVKSVAGRILDETREKSASAVRRELQPEEKPVEKKKERGHKPTPQDYDELERKITSLSRLLSDGAEWYYSGNKGKSAIAVETAAKNLATIANQFVKGWR